MEESYWWLSVVHYAVIMLRYSKMCDVGTIGYMVYSFLASQWWQCSLVMVRIWWSFISAKTDEFARYRKWGEQVKMVCVSPPVLQQVITELPNG